MPCRLGVIARSSPLLSICTIEKVILYDEIVLVKGLLLGLLLGAGATTSSGLLKMSYHDENRVLTRDAILAVLSQ
jgi:hypothetical protein